MLYLGSFSIFWYKTKTKAHAKYSVTQPLIHVDNLRIKLWVYKARTVQKNRQTDCYFGIKYIVIRLVSLLIFLSLDIKSGIYFVELLRNFIYFA